MSYRDLVNTFSVTPLGGWIARTVASRIDPYLYRVSGGRLTTTGPLTIPQLTLTTRGRKSGRPRTVQLGYVLDGSHLIVVASNFGAERHPAWAYNLEAHPDATVRLGATTRTVVATRLSDAEKAALWPKITAAIPQQKCYVERTDRNIKVFRLITTSLRVGGFF